PSAAVPNVSQFGTRRVLRSTTAAVVATATMAVTTSGSNGTRKRLVEQVAQRRAHRRHRRDSNHGDERGQKPVLDEVLAVTSGSELRDNFPESAHALSPFSHRPAAMWPQRASPGSSGRWRPRSCRSASEPQRPRARSARPATRTRSGPGLPRYARRRARSMSSSRRPRLRRGGELRLDRLEDGVHARAGQRQSRDGDERDQPDEQRVLDQVLALFPTNELDDAVHVLLLGDGVYAAAASFA